MLQADGMRARVPHMLCSLSLCSERSHVILHQEPDPLCAEQAAAAASWLFLIASISCIKHEPQSRLTRHELPSGSVADLCTAAVLQRSVVRYCQAQHLHRLKGRAMHAWRHRLQVSRRPDSTAAAAVAAPRRRQRIDTGRRARKLDTGGDDSSNAARLRKMVTKVHDARTALGSNVHVDVDADDLDVCWPLLDEAWRLMDDKLRAAEAQGWVLLSELCICCLGQRRRMDIFLVLSSPYVRLSACIRAVAVNTSLPP